MQLKKLLFPLALTSTLFLTACSSGAPSTSDIETTLKQSFEEVMAPMKALGMDIDANDMFKNIKNHGCKKLDGRENYYECDVEIESKNIMTGKYSTDREMVKMFKTDAGWRVN